MNTEKLELFIQKHNMLPRGTKVLCAVSGGADSVALLHFLSRMEGVEVAAAHYNHCLRGEESDGDESFVASLCEGLGIECVVGRGDVSAYAAESGKSTEDAARTLRYEFLRKAAAELGCSRIATAHNADDNAETVLLNMTRGSGLKGLCGIPPVRGEIVRPFLQTTREEIEQYLAENGLEHIEDSSNAADDYSRNRIRHHVTPVLRELNPAFSAAVARMTESLREDEEYLSSAAIEFIGREAEGNSIGVDAVMSLEEPVRMRVFRLMHGGELSAVHCRAIENICLVRSVHAHADVPGMRVSREFDKLIFGAEESREIECRELAAGEKLWIAELGAEISCEFVPSCREIHKSLNTFYLKSESICDKLSFSSRREGDEIRLEGRNCTKSLKKLFSESKMELGERKKRLVFRDGSGVVAVSGFGIAERCRAEIGDNCIVIKVIIKK